LVRLISLVGPPWRGVSGKPLSFGILTAGHSFVLSAYERRRLWFGRPYLRGVITTSEAGSAIIGRFNPDAWVFVTAQLVLLVGGVCCAGLAEVGPVRFTKLIERLIESELGIAAAGGLAACIIFATLRARGWRRKCDAIANAVKTTCEAS